MGEEAKKREKTREDRTAREMDELGSEVFNLKLAMQDYEDRLAKLYQTEDRSKWRGPAVLLVSGQRKERDEYCRRTERGGGMRARAERHSLD